jgi:ribosome maturation factor RimP
VSGTKQKVLMSGFIDQIRKIAEDVSAREGCSLWDLEFIGAGQGRVLRVYIEKPGVEGGVSIDDCSNVSRAINLMLDVEDVIPGGPYSLEVSSPGLERVLKQKWHYEQMVGKQILVRTFAPLLDLNPEVPELGKAKQLTGELSQVNETGVQIKWNEKFVNVPFEQITKAHSVFEFGSPADKNPKNKLKNKKK